MTSKITYSLENSQMSILTIFYLTIFLGTEKIPAKQSMLFLKTILTKKD
jgi:hypothetical protein